MGGEMPKIAFDPVSLIRIGSYTAELERRHLWGTDEDIDQEFNSVCRTIWGYTLDDFDDDCLTKEDHDWLDELTPRRAYRFAADQGYDLGDYVNGEIVSDWWGFVWMILAEKRGLLKHEQQALAWKKHDERLLARENAVGVIRNECK
jgi:hypothetical protein